MNKGIAVAGNMIVDMLYPTNGLPRPGELVTITGNMTRATGGCLCNDIIDLAVLDPALPLTALGWATTPRAISCWISCGPGPTSIWARSGAGAPRPTRW